MMNLPIEKYTNRMWPGVQTNLLYVTNQTILPIMPKFFTHVFLQKFLQKKKTVL